jgi:error-prone DNA polymerase
MTMNTMTSVQRSNWIELSKRFTRDIPEDEAYILRLAEELEIITEQDFTKHFLRVLEVLELTRDIPHITRGSAGSSLVCYLLGITDVDPVKEHIPLARFLNPHRDDLPDIDIDFPHYHHREVMERIYRRWPGKSARLSNYVRYRERTAQKESFKRITGHVGKIHGNQDIEQLVPKERRAEWRKLTNKLIGKKRCISKHPGGIVVFDRAPAASLIRQDHQILLDKHECEDLAFLKIDVLSNRGLAQLIDCSGRHPMDYPDEDEATAELLARGNTIGVTQAESPVMRRTLRTLRVQNKRDLTIATALIRPAAMTGRTKGVFFRDYIGHNGRPGDIGYKGGLIFDEDATQLIMEQLGCDPFTADMYRRGFIKGNEEMCMDFLARIGNSPRRDEIMELFTHMHGFGLCKAHAINLANLIWGLAYEKVHNPKRFWLSTLQNNCSMYRPWVHMEQAKAAGWHIQGNKRPWRVEGDVLCNDDWQVPIFDSHEDQLRRRGFWTHDEFMPGCYYTELGNMATFRGLVATHRMYCRGWHKGKKEFVTFCTLGTDSRQYHELIFPCGVPLGKFDIVEGSGIVEIHDNNLTVKVTKWNCTSL